MLQTQFSPDELRAGRTAAKLTQRQAAELIGVERNTISRWESGASVPQRLALATAIRVYGLEVEAGLPENVGRILLARIDRLEQALQALTEEMRRARNEHDLRPGGHDVAASEDDADEANDPPL